MLLDRKFCIIHTLQIHELQKIQKHWMIWTVNLNSLGPLNVQTVLEIKQSVTVFKPATEWHFFTSTCSSLQEKRLWLCLETQENDLVRLEVMPPHPLSWQISSWSNSYSPEQLLWYSEVQWNQNTSNVLWLLFIGKIDSCAVIPLSTAPKLGVDLFRLCISGRQYMQYFWDS